MVANCQPAYIDRMLPLTAYFHVAMTLLIYGAALTPVECASSDVHLQLLKYLNNRSESFMRPVNDTTQAVLVGLRFAPMIAYLDDMKQELTVHGRLALKWTDYFLQWQPADFGDINETTIPLSYNGEQKFWIPELSVYESLITDFHSFYPETTSVRLHYTGEIHWYTLATTKSYCRVENEWFPFDVQRCNLTFTTWLYQDNEQKFDLIFDVVENGTGKQELLRNELWNVTIVEPVEVNTKTYDCEICNGKKQSYVRYNFVLKRKYPVWFCWTLLLPCVVISILMAFIPCMKQGDGVDVPNYALTCVLALFVYLFYLYTTLPSTGPALFLGLYISSVILAGIIAVGCAVCGTRDSDNDGETQIQAKHDGRDKKKERRKSKNGEETPLLKSTTERPRDEKGGPVLAGKAQDEGKAQDTDEGKDEQRNKMNEIKKICSRKKCGITVCGWSFLGCLFVTFVIFFIMGTVLIML